MKLGWLLVGTVVAAVGCARPECSPVDYRSAECRRQAALALSSGTGAEGVQVSFDGVTGHVGQRNGQLVARVATLGSFALSVRRAPGGPKVASLQVHNVHPLVPALPGELRRRGLVRELLLPLPDAGVRIEGELPAEACSAGMWLAAVGDVQTGTVVFEGLLEALHGEARAAEAAGVPLMGLLLLGDLSEDGSPQELQRVAELLQGSPVPVAVTPGNHDVYSRAQPVFTEIFGPGSYAFDVCDTRLVMLDSGSADLAPSVQARLQGWLANAPQHLIAGTHIPPYAADTANGFRREDQAHHLLAELAAHQADLLLAGHIHARMEMTGGPVEQVVVGTAGGSQGQRDPDFGWLRLQLGARLERCFVSLPASGSPGVGEGKLPPDC
ncbi:MAG: metallophosphoesterase [Myxococcales bacterium]|nr:metallophosphoesterase [Myxococcales bacterium]